MTSNIRFRPDFSSGRVDVPDVGGILTEFADRQANRTDKGLDRAIKQQQLEEEQKRWNIANARAEAEWDRKQQEQKSADAYYDILAKGPQTSGGVLNTQALINESNKYALTPQEIELSKTLLTPEQARAAGNTQLAEKLAWQQNLSNFVDQNYMNQALQESRSEMYERAMGTVRDQGLPVLSGMVDKLDTARLAESEAESKKLKDIDDRIADLKKNELATTKWAIGQQNVGSGNVAPVTDTEGNITGYTSNAQVKREANLDDKYDANKAIGEQLILSEVNKLQVSDKKTTGEDALKLYREIIKDPTVDPKSAATAVVGGIGTKEGAWYNPWSKDVGTFKDSAVKDLSALLRGTRTPEELSSTGTSTNTSAGTFKSNAARDLAILSGAQDAATISQLQAQREALLQGSGSRRESRVNELLRAQGILPSTTPEVGGTATTLKDTKMPQSLVQAEGVRNEPYKDTKGIVTVGVGYAFNKDRAEIESDFKAAGIPLEKIDGLMKQDGTKLTNKEVASLADVSYDRHGVQKLKGIGIDVDKLNPTLAEIGVSQAFRGDVVKGGEGYRGKLYEYLKNDDLAGMTNYVKSSKEVPEEVKQRLALVTDRYGAMTREQAEYDGIPTSPSIKDLFSNVNTRLTVLDDQKNKLAEKNAVKANDSLNELEKGRILAGINNDITRMGETLPTKDRIQNRMDAILDPTFQKDLSLNPVGEPLTYAGSKLLREGFRSVNAVKENIAIPLSNYLESNSPTATEKTEVANILKAYLPGANPFNLTAKEKESLSSTIRNRYDNNPMAFWESPLGQLILRTSNTLR